MRCGPALVGLTGKSNMAVGMYTVAQALGISTTPESRPSPNEASSQTVMKAWCRSSGENRRVFSANHITFGALKYPSSVAPALERASSGGIGGVTSSSRNMLQ